MCYITVYSDAFALPAFLLAWSIMVKNPEPEIGSYFGF